MNFIYKLERKFGRFAIKNLSLILVICYAAGYIMSYVNPVFLTYLSLDPYAIVHGQVWRLVSWVLIPPDRDNIFFALIMIFFYYSIGTTLERVWGSFQYNLYIFSGMFFTVIGSFLLMAFCYVFRQGDLTGWIYNVGDFTLTGASAFFRFVGDYYFSTYYVNMSIFLAFAATFPEERVYIMFIIPMKVKWLGIIYGIMLAHTAVTSIFYNQMGYAVPFVIGSSLLNFLVFFLTTRRYIRMNRSQRKMHREYKQREKAERRATMMGATKHKCALCGKTEKDGDELVFRYCSKCEGNFEFCQEHLYTHIHYVKNNNNT